MPIRETAARVIAQECSGRAPSELSGDAAAVCAALALALGGGAFQPRLKTLVFSKGGGGVPASRGVCESVTDRLFVLADADAAAEAEVRLAVRKPAMLAGEAEKKVRALDEVLNRACGVSIELLRAVCEAHDIISARAGEDSDLVRAGAASGIALSAGAMRAVLAEIYARCARLSEAGRAERFIKEAGEACSERLQRSDAACAELLSGLRQAALNER